MDVLVSSYINALNGTTVTIPCTFTSCYKIDRTKFAMNWTYQENLNNTEEKVSCQIFKYINTKNTCLQSLNLHLSHIFFSLSSWLMIRIKECYQYLQTGLETGLCFLVTWRRMTYRSRYRTFSWRTRGFTTVMWGTPQIASKDMVSLTSMLSQNVRCCIIFFYKYIKHNPVQLFPYFSANDIKQHGQWFVSPTITAWCRQLLSLSDNKKHLASLYGFYPCMVTICNN